MISLIVFKGSNIVKSGHYFGYNLNFDKKWYKLDDATVEKNIVSAVTVMTQDLPFIFFNKKCNSKESIMKERYDMLMDCYGGVTEKNSSSIGYSNWW